MTINIVMYFLDHNSSTGRYQWRYCRGMGQEKEEIMGGRKVEVDEGEKKGEIIFHLYITAGLKVITSWNLGLSLGRGLGSLSSDLPKCSALGIKSVEM